MSQFSTDTNIWISLCHLGVLEMAFQLGHHYLMEESAANDEILSPPNLLGQLRGLGLTETPLSKEEFNFVWGHREKYPRLSVYDLYALAIAKCRSLTLLTSDGPLRKAAINEGVPVHGLLWIIVECSRAAIISPEEKNRLLDLIEENLSDYRLKKEDIQKARRM